MVFVFDKVAGYDASLIKSDEYNALALPAKTALP
jgi:hypothetical protein